MSQAKRPRLGGLDTRTAAELRAWLASDDGREARAAAAWGSIVAEARRQVSAEHAAALRDELREQAGRERWRRAAGLPPSPDSTSTPDPSGCGAAASALGADASLTASLERPGASDGSAHVSGDRNAHRGSQGHSTRGDR